MNVTTHVSGEVAHLRLSRPHKRNAIDGAMADEIADAVRTFVDDGVKVAILEGEPPAFCAGADLVEMGARPIGAVRTPLNDVVELLVTQPIFWICSMNGPVVGGGVSIASVCPYGVAGEAVTFSLPERALGFFAAGALPYVESAIPPRRASAMALSGESMPASTAQELGLVNAVVPSSEVASHAIDHARDLIRTPNTTDSCRAAWQARFATPEFVHRRDTLMKILASVETPPGGHMS